MTVTVTLSTPLEIPDPVTGTVSALTDIVLREPTLDDVCGIGYPFVIGTSDGGGTVELRPAVIRKYLSKLSGHPPSTFKTLSIADFSTLQAAIMGFFGDSAAET